MKKFYNLEEMKEYYNSKTDTFYIEDDIEILFDLHCTWNIIAYNIVGSDITAWNIDCHNLSAYTVLAKGRINAIDINVMTLKAYGIHALNIKYWDICVAYKDIECYSIRGYRSNSVHLSLDNKDAGIKILKVC